MSMFNEDTGNVDLGATMPELKRYNDEFGEGVFMEDKDGTVVRKDSAGLAITAYNDYDLLVLGNTAQLIHKGVVGNTNWNGFFEALPGTFRSGLSQLQLTRLDINQSVNGTVAVNPTDETTLIINWDEDTIPSDMVLTGSTGDRNKIDYIIDPTNFNPTTIKSNGVRVLLLGSIGSATNTDGADAWKNNDGTDFIASENDIVEWTGTKWQILFDSSTVSDIKFVTNLNTSIQYKWTGTEWVKSIEGEYRNGAWRIQF